MAKTVYAVAWVNFDQIQYGKKKGQWEVDQSYVDPRSTDEQNKNKGYYKIFIPVPKELLEKKDIIAKAG